MPRLAVAVMLDLRRIGRRAVTDERAELVGEGGTPDGSEARRHGAMIVPS